MSQGKISQNLLFGAHLQELMARDDLTQRQLAVAIGISQSAISQYLNGMRAAPGVEEAIALASHFGVTVDWLLGVDSSPLARPAARETEARAKRDAELEQVAKTLEEQAVKLRKLLSIGGKGRPRRGSGTADS